MNADVRAAYAKIEILDLSMIERELTDESRGHGWSQEKAIDAIHAYRLFLKLRAKHKNVELIPTELIDAVWHSHILHTEQYVQACTDIFGVYIHHRPTFKKTDAQMRAFKNKFKATQKLMFDEFGQDISNRVAGFCLDPSPSCCCWKLAAAPTSPSPSAPTP